MLPNNAVLRVVIPARYGSSRLPGKPLLDLGGKPMVVRVYEKVSEALLGADIVVATDDDRILDVLVKESIPTVLTADNHESGTDRAAEVARIFAWGDTDIVINVQGDEPLVPIEMLRSFAQFCCSHTDFSMGTIAVPIDEKAMIHDPNIVKLTVNYVGNVIAFSRAAIPVDRDGNYEKWEMLSYLRHVGVYAYSNSVLQKLTATPPCLLENVEKLEQLRAQWLGIPVHVMKWHNSPPHGIDTPDDFARISAYF
ncbi:3-deoxy-D-manno-octulosonate cytidylyltransferase [gamma proteobacterium BDW918]|nr:3-deoxy-D-manno-octulosonate cytidylyltransferase [gamma proteobacterium BDW918]